MRAVDILANGTDAIRPLSSFASLPEMLDTLVRWRVSRFLEGQGGLKMGRSFAGDVCRSPGRRRGVWVLWQSDGTGGIVSIDVGFEVL